MSRCKPAFFMMVKQFIFISLATVMFACGSNTEPDNSNATSSDTSLSTVDAQEDSLNKVLREDPNNEEAYILRGRLKYNQSKFQGALGDAKRALEVDTTNPEALLLAGEAYFSMDDYFASQKSFENCIAANKKYSPCFEKLAEINLLRKNYDKAMGYVNDALRIDERNYYPYYLKGWIYQERGDSATAASSFQTSVELKPDFYDGYIMLGSLYYNENHPLCVQYFSTALEILPSSTEAMYFLGMYYQNNLKPTEALSVYKRMMEVDASDVRPLYNSGFINLTQTENFDSAITYFDAAISLNPEYHQAYYNRGLAYLEKGDKSKAVLDFQKAIDINRDYTLAIKALNKLQGS